MTRYAEIRADILSLEKSNRLSALAGSSFPVTPLNSTYPSISSLPPHTSDSALTTTPLPNKGLDLRSASLPGTVSDPSMPRSVTWADLVTPESLGSNEEQLTPPTSSLPPSSLD